jgi:hypothetical protein
MAMMGVSRVLRRSMASKGTRTGGRIRPLGASRL